MSLLGSWYQVEGDTHYWRNGFVRSGCGILNRPQGLPVAPLTGCEPCLNRYEMDVDEDDLVVAESKIGHAVLADAMLDVIQVDAPLSPLAKMWMRDHGLKARTRDRRTYISFVVGGTVRDLVLEPGSVLVSTPHGDFFQVARDDFENRYRCVEPKNLLR